MKRALLPLVITLACIAGLGIQSPSPSIQRAAYVASDVTFYYPKISDTYPDQGAPSGARTFYADGKPPSLGWVGDPCSARRAYELTGDPTAVMAGWSLGRLGILYYLDLASDEQLRKIDHVIMIDPGSYVELATSGSCDIAISKDRLPPYQRGGEILVHFLTVNPNARVTVLAGPQTADPETTIDGRAHAGIQTAYFQDLKNAGGGLTSRVTVCNYEGNNDGKPQPSEHMAMYNGSKDQLSALTPGSCPTIAGMSFEQSWTP